MAISRRSIFRDSAMKHYMQKQEKDILPRVVSPPVFVFLWILLGFLTMAGLLAWWGEVPTYESGSGIILEEKSHSKSGNSEAIAVIFLPASSAPKLRTGLPIQLQIGSTGSRFTSTIERIEPGILSPSEARTRYAFASGVSQVLTQPSVLATVRLGSTISARTYAGSLVSAQVQVGLRRPLSLLPGFDRLIGVE